MHLMKAWSETGRQSVVREELLKDDAKVTQVEMKWGSVQASCFLFWVSLDLWSDVLLFLHYVHWRLNTPFCFQNWESTSVCPEVYSSHLVFKRQSHLFIRVKSFLLLWKETDSLFCCDAQQRKMLTIMNRPTSAYWRAVVPLRLTAPFVVNIYDVRPLQKSLPTWRRLKQALCLNGALRALFLSLERNVWSPSLHSDPVTCWERCRKGEAASWAAEADMDDRTPLVFWFWCPVQQTVPEFSSLQCLGCKEEDEDEDCPAGARRHHYASYYYSKWRVNVLLGEKHPQVGCRVSLESTSAAWTHLLCRCIFLF